MNKYVWNFGIINNDIQQQHEMTAEKRLIIIDQLYSIITYLKYPTSYFHRCVRLFDVMLNIYDIKDINVEFIATSLVGIVGSYFDEYPPEINSLMEMTDETFTEKQLSAMQFTLLNEFDWNIFYGSYYDLVSQYFDTKNDDRTSALLMCTYLVHYNDVSYINLYAVSNIIIKIIERKEIKSVTKDENIILTLLLSLQEIDRNDPHNIKTFINRHFIFLSSLKFQAHIKYIRRLSPQICENEEKKYEKIKIIKKNHTDILTLGKKLGEGTYGAVYKADVVENAYAIKIYHDQYKSNTNLREIVALKNIQSENVVKIYDVIRNKEISVTMELCDYDLHYLIYKSETKTITNDEIIKGLISGIYDVHKYGFVHRDLKPDNVLIKNNVIKIADFGLSTHVDDKEELDDAIYDICTIWYRAPELVLRVSFNERPQDIWSLACIIYEIYNKKPLFDCTSDKQLIDLIYQHFGTPTNDNWPGITFHPMYHKTLKQYTASNRIEEYFNGKLSPEKIALVKRMFILDPSKRINIEELKELWT